MGYAQATVRLRRTIAKVAATGSAPVAIVRRSLVNNLGRVMVGIRSLGSKMDDGGTVSPYTGCDFARNWLSIARSFMG